jgi:hypothetical protein
MKTITKHVLLEKLVVTQPVKTLPAQYGTYSETYECSPHPPILLFKIHFNVILQYPLRLRTDIFPSGLPTKILYFPRMLHVLPISSDYRNIIWRRAQVFDVVPSPPPRVPHVLCETMFRTNTKQRIHYSSHQLEDEKTLSNQMGSKRSSNLTCSCVNFDFRWGQLKSAHCLRQG